MQEDKSYIQQAIYYLLKENAFVGTLLQEINIRVSEAVPTAALAYDKQDSKFEVLINDKFFAGLTLDERVGVFFHEILHFTHGHILRFENMGTPKDQQLKNIAADMSINQYIKVLPKGCVNYADWKQQDGTAFPPFQATEVYFDLLKQTTKPPEEGNGNEGDGEGSAEQKLKNGNQNAGDQKGQQANWDKMKDYKEFDQHDWDQLTEDEKQRMMQEAKKTVSRAVDKTYKDSSLIPDSVKELLEKIETQIKKLDYKALIKYAIKKTLTTQDRTGTWYRPNKRYGTYAKGSTNDKAPYINIYIDTSGSISHRELNEFLAVMDGFLRNSAKKCNLALWHTDMYSIKPYKLGHNFNYNNVQSGGTDVACVIEHIEKTKPNLSVILTDGYFSRVKKDLTQKTIWVIAKNGTIEHPHKDHGITVKMDGLTEKE